MITGTKIERRTKGERGFSGRSSVFPRFSLGFSIKKHVQAIDKDQLKNVTIGFSGFSAPSKFSTYIKGKNKG